MKNSALTVGAITLLSGGISLASGTGAKRLKKYNLRVTFWKDGTTWSVDEAEGDEFTSGGDLQQQDTPQNLKPDGDGRPGLTGMGGYDVDDENGVVVPGSVVEEDCGANDPKNPSAWSFTTFGNPSAITKLVSTNPNRYKKGWEYNFIITVTAWSH